MAEIVIRTSEQYPLKLTFLRIIAIVLAICAVAYICVQPQTSNDFWLQAKVGELIVRYNSIPSTLLFPFTEVQTQKFNAHEWLSSVLFYYFIATFGEAALPLLLGFGGLTLFALLTWLAYRRAGNNLPWALILGLVAIGIENYRHFLRPELLSLILLGLYLHVLETYRKRPSPSAWLGATLLVIVWTNTHGSFILAPVIAGIYSVGLWIDAYRSPGRCKGLVANRSRAFAVLAFTTAACTLVNPFGWKLLWFVMTMEDSFAMKEFIPEWFSIFDPRIRRLPGILIGVTGAISLTLLCLINWQKLSWVDILLTLMFLVLAVRANRFLVYVGFAIIAVVPVLLNAHAKAIQVESKLYGICSIFSATIILSAYHYGNVNGASPHKSNVYESLTGPMIKVLSDSKLQGNVYTSYDFGAELVYRAYPRMRPSIDSRIDSYGDAYFIKQQDLLENNNDMANFVSRYDVRYMLLTHGDFQHFMRQRNWIDGNWLIYAADTHAIFLQRSDISHNMH